MNGVGVKVNRDTRRAVELRGIDRPKPDPVLVHQPGFKVGAVEGRRHLMGRDPPTRRRVLVPAKLADLLRARIPRIEMRSGKRPAMIREPVPGLEIDGIEGQTITTPMVGRPAEKTQPGCRQILERQTDAFPVVKFLRFLVEFHPAAFHQRDPERCIFEGPCEGNTSGARTHDTDFRLHDCPGRDRARVDNHTKSATDDAGPRLLRIVLAINPPAIFRQPDKACAAERNRKVA